MSKTLIGIGVGTMVGIVATLGGVALAQPTTHTVSQVYSYSDN